MDEYQHLRESADTARAPHPVDTFLDNASDEWLRAMVDRSEIASGRVLGLPTRSRGDETRAVIAGHGATIMRRHAWARRASGSAGPAALVALLAAEHRFVPRRVPDAYVLGFARRGLRDLMAALRVGP